MVRIAKSTKVIIILAIIAASLGISAKKTGLLKKNQNLANSKDLIRAEKFFELAENHSKIRVTYSNVDVKKLKQDINNLFNKNAVKISDEVIGGNEYYVKVEMPTTKADEITKKLIEIDETAKIKKTTNSEHNKYIDFETRIKQNQDYLTLLDSKIKKARGIDFTKIKAEQVEAQNEIDRLKQRQKQQVKNQNFSVLLLSAKAISTNKNNVKKIVEFFKLSLILLVAFTIIALVGFGFIVVLLKIMSALGIRSTRTVSRYGYNYGEYGYSRRKKRIYKKATDND